MFSGLVFTKGIIALPGKGGQNCIGVFSLI